MPYFSQQVSILKTLKKYKNVLDIIEKILNLLIVWETVTGRRIKQLAQLLLELSRTFFLSGITSATSSAFVTKDISCDGASAFSRIPTQVHSQPPSGHSQHFSPHLRSFSIFFFPTEVIFNLSMYVVSTLSLPTQVILNLFSLH